MVERVGLEQPARGKSQPFVTIQAIVRTYAHHTPRQGAETRRPLFERLRGRVSKSKRNIAPAHLEQLLKRRTAVRTGWKQARACRDVMSKLGDRLFVAAEALPAAPSLDEKSVHESERFGRESSSVQGARHPELALADA